jgi:hypothetical protein
MGEMNRTNIFLFFLLFKIFVSVCRGAAVLYLTNFAGNGTTGFLGENLPATSAEMNPTGLW